MLGAPDECAACVAILDGAYASKKWLAKLNKQDGHKDVSRYLVGRSVWEIRSLEYPKDTDNVLVMSFDAEHNTPSD